MLIKASKISVRSKHPHTYKHTYKAKRQTFICKLSEYLHFHKIIHETGLLTAIQNVSPFNQRPPENHQQNKKSIPQKRQFLFLIGVFFLWNSLRVTKDFFLSFFVFRQRGSEGEREGDKHQCVVASHLAPTGDLACNPGMCPDWESNWQPFGLQPMLNPLSYTIQGQKTKNFKVKLITVSSTIEHQISRNKFNKMCARTSH